MLCATQCLLANPVGAACIAPRWLAVSAAATGGLPAMMSVAAGAGDILAGTSGSACLGPHLIGRACM
jgi:hypothetical protein